MGDNMEDRAARRALIQYYMKTAFPLTSILLLITVVLVAFSGPGKGITAFGVSISPLDVTAAAYIGQMVQNFINQVFTLIMVMNNAMFGNNKENNTAEK